MLFEGCLDGGDWWWFEARGLRSTAYERGFVTLYIQVSSRAIAASPKCHDRHLEKRRSVRDCLSMVQTVRSSVKL